MELVRFFLLVACFYFALVALLSLAAGLFALRKGRAAGAAAFRRVWLSWFLHFLNPLNWL